jgi:hypothetical protein
MKVRKETFDELQTMKMDNNTYVYEYLKNMEQTKKVIKETWNLADLALEEKDYELRYYELCCITKQVPRLLTCYYFHENSS